LGTIGDTAMKDTVDKGRWGLGGGATHKRVRDAERKANNPNPKKPAKKPKKKKSVDKTVDDSFWGS